MELHDGMVEEVVVQSVERTDSAFYVLSVQEFSDGSRTAKVIVDVEVQVELIYSYMNEEMSCWDHETRGYLWRTLCRERGSFGTQFELILDLDISDLEVNQEFDSTTKEGQAKLDLLARKSIAYVDIHEMPDSICFYNDKCVGHELLQTMEVPY